MVSKITFFFNTKKFEVGLVIFLNEIWVLKLQALKCRYFIESGSRSVKRETRFDNHVYFETGPFGCHYDVINFKMSRHFDLCDVKVTSYMAQW